MSNYFRSAARCDRTVAADAPVPLYNADLPPPENHPIDENNTSTGIDDYRSFDERSVAKYTTGGGGGGPSASSSLARSRALLDHQRHTDDRLLQKREANVMTKLAVRVEAMNRRIEQEAELNARLLATVKKTFPDRPAVVEGDEGAGETSQPSAVVEEGDRANRISIATAANQQPPPSPTEIGQQQPSSLHNLSLKETIAALQEASNTIPLFQLIQTEEERNARRVLVPTTSSAPANITIQEKRKLTKQQQARPRCEGEIVVGGSIQAMYNDLTLQELRETFPDVPPSVLVERFADRILVPTASASNNNNNRQKSGIFPNRSGSSSSTTTPNDDAAVAVLPSSTLPVVAEVIHRTSSHAQRLRDALERVRQSEQEAAAVQLLQQSERDRQRSTLLMELVTQDRLRHKAAEEKRLYQLVKYHEQTLIGSFVSTVQRVTPAVAAAAAPSSLDHSGGRGGGPTSSSLSLPVDADVERVLADPSLPKVPENVKRALQQSRKPPHPIDLYQAKVRAEMGIPLE